jgi:HK97 family phage major capsid protein
MSEKTIMIVDFSTIVPQTARQRNWLHELRSARSPLKLTRQLHADLRREAQSLLDAAAAKGALSEAEEARQQALIADITFIEALNAKCEEANEALRALGAQNYQRAQEAEGLFGNEEAHLSRLRMLQAKGPGQGRKFADLFGPPQQANQFKSFNEFCGIITRGQYDPRLMMAGMTEGVPSSGGYATPTEYVSVILDRSLESEVVRSRAQVVPMTSNTRKVGIIANKDNTTSAPFGGLSLAWLDEAGSIGLKQAELRMITLSAKKAGMIVPISNELLEDGVGFDAQIGTVISQSVGWGLDDAFLNGNGASGKPLGVLQSPSLIVVPKAGGQTAPFEWENLVTMYSRLLPGSIPNSIWIANPSCIPGLMQVSIPAGTAGITYPALNERNGTFSLLGRPVVMTEKVPSVRLQSDLTLVDLSLYVIGMRKDITIDRSQHAAFSTDETHIRAILRCDGMPVMDASVKPKNGPTLSWAVTLAARP